MMEIVFIFFLQSLSRSKISVVLIGWSQNLFIFFPIIKKNSLKSIIKYLFTYGQNVIYAKNTFQTEDNQKFQNLSLNEVKQKTDPFSSFSLYFDNVYKKLLKKINKVATNATYISKNSSYSLIHRNQTKLLESKGPAFLFGEEFTFKQKSDFIEKFQNIIWLSYRVDEGNDESDAGWGCMIRVCQMLLAQALTKSEHQLSLTDIFIEFTNTKKASFSLIRICEVAMIQHCWASSAEILQAIQELLCDQEKYTFYLQNYSQVISQSNMKAHKYPLIVTITNRVGQETIPKNYYSHIFKVLKHKNSIGMIGGIGGQAFYFVGYHENQLIYLDPHYVQNSSSGIFSCQTPRGIPIKEISPSLVFCYYFSSQQEHLNWILDIGETCHIFHPHLAIQMDKKEAQQIYKARNEQIIETDDEFQVLE